MLSFILSTSFWMLFYSQSGSGSLLTERLVNGDSQLMDYKLRSVSQENACIQDCGFA